MEKDSTLTTESYISMPTIVSSAARVNFNQTRQLSVKMAMTTETYMDRLSVPLCMDNWSHHNTKSKRYLKATVETRNRTAKPIVDV
jgi:hypothetical protein